MTNVISNFRNTFKNQFFTIYWDYTISSRIKSSPIAVITILGDKSDIHLYPNYGICTINDWKKRFTEKNTYLYILYTSNDILYRINICIDDLIFLFSR